MECCVNERLGRASRLKAREKSQLCGQSISIRGKQLAKRQSRCRPQHFGANNDDFFDPCRVLEDSSECPCQSRTTLFCNRENNGDRRIRDRLCGPKFELIQRPKGTRPRPIERTWGVEYDWMNFPPWENRIH